MLSCSPVLISANKVSTLHAAPGASWLQVSGRRYVPYCAAPTYLGMYCLPTVVVCMVETLTGAYLAKYLPRLSLPSPDHVPTQLDYLHHDYT